MALAVVIGFGGVALALHCLNGAGWRYATILLALTGGWFLSTHFRPGIGRLLPKELSVGIIFAAGCLVQPLSFAPEGVDPIHMPVGAVLFAWLCFQNCASITVWESLPTDANDPRSLLNGWSRAVRWIPRLGLAHLAICAFVLALALPPAFGQLVCALTLSSALLWALNHRARERRPQLSRALADIALLTPLIFLI